MPNQELTIIPFVAVSRNNFNIKHISDKFFELPKTNDLKLEEQSYQYLNFPLPIFSESEIAETSCEALLQNFLQKKGEDFKNGVKNLLGLLKHWAEENQIEIQNPDSAGFKAFKTLDTYLVDYSGTDQQINHIRLPLYQEGIPLLAKILCLLQDESISLSNRRDEFNRLLHNICVCEPGVHTHLLHAYLNLYAFKDIAAKWLSIRLALAEQILISTDVMRMMDPRMPLHYRNSVINWSSAALGFQPIEDRYTGLCKRDPVNALAKIFVEEFSKHVTPKSIIDMIVSEIDQEKFLENLRKKPYIVLSFLNQFGSDEEFNLNSLIDQDQLADDDTFTFSKDWQKHIRLSLFIRLKTTHYFMTNTIKAGEWNQAKIFLDLDYSEFSYVIIRDPFSNDSKRVPFINYCVELLGSKAHPEEVAAILQLITTHEYGGRFRNQFMKSLIDTLANPLLECFLKIIPIQINTMTDLLEVLDWVPIDHKIEFFCQRLSAFRHVIMSKDDFVEFFNALGDGPIDKLIAHPGSDWLISKINSFSASNCSVIMELYSKQQMEYLFKIIVNNSEIEKIYLYIVNEPSENWRKLSLFNLAFELLPSKDLKKLIRRMSANDINSGIDVINAPSPSASLALFLSFRDEEIQQEVLGRFNSEELARIYVSNSRNLFELLNVMSADTANTLFKILGVAQIKRLFSVPIDMVQMLLQEKREKVVLLIHFFKKEDPSHLKLILQIMFMKTGIKQYDQKINTLLNVCNRIGDAFSKVLLDIMIESYKDHLREDPNRKPSARMTRPKKIAVLDQLADAIKNNTQHLFFKPESEITGRKLNTLIEIYQKVYTPYS